MPGMILIHSVLPLATILVYLASAGSLGFTSMMSTGWMPPSTRARISALVAEPSLIQVSAAAGEPILVKSVLPPTLAT